jgi:hypothetical protein
MSNNSNVASRRIILTAEQLNSRQHYYNNVNHAVIDDRNKYQVEVDQLLDMDENENYLLGYN